MDIKYISSSGKEYNLLGEKMRATSGNFHSYSWKAKAKEKAYGSNVYGFTKESLSYKLVLTLRGDLDDRKKLLDEIGEAFEEDVAKISHGKFYFGQYYIKGYVINSVTSPSELQNYWSQREIEIFCPYPFWVEEEKISFVKYSEQGSGRFLDFPYNFPYDYTGTQKGTSILDNDHYIESDFRMTIFGPVVAPMIIIGGREYVINVTVEENEYLEVDSKEGSVKRVQANGNVIDEFNNRGFEQSVFTPIPPGRHTVNWSGDFGFDIILLKERSEPKWIQKNG